MSDKFATVPARAGSEVDHIIGAANGFLIVLYDEHSVSEVPQLCQRLQQTVVVAMMQADGRLIQHIQHAAQFRSDLGR